MLRYERYFRKELIESQRVGLKNRLSTADWRKLAELEETVDTLCEQIVALTEIQEAQSKITTLKVRKAIDEWCSIGSDGAWRSLTYPQRYSLANYIAIALEEEK